MIVIMLEAWTLLCVQWRTEYCKHMELETDRT